MSLLTSQEIEDFKKNGAIVIRKKFDINWIKKLKKGIERDIKIQKETGEIYLLTDDGSLWRMYK